MLIRGLLTVLLCLLLALWCHGPLRVLGQLSTCPLECGEAALAWCESTFGRGGYLSVEDCGDGESFECRCNNASSINVTVTHDESSQGPVCNWTNEEFESMPGGGYCTPTTALCPSSCADIDAFFCETTPFCEENTTTGLYNFSCTTCQGRKVSIVGTNESCSKHYSAKILCSPETTCNGHGCCVHPESNSSPVCRCFANSSYGHWAQPRCSECEAGYDPGKGCREPSSNANIVYVLSSIASTWTMLSPNLAVPVLFVVLGVARRLWDSDRAFALTALRRAHLAPVQTARRHQQSLFHSKYVPRRPAKSRCFINESAEGVRAGRAPRGPPAY